MKTNSDTATALYIGPDAHKEQTTVAIADPGSDGEVRHHGSVATSHIALEKVVRRIAGARRLPLGALHVCYEAGGRGMWIARHFARIGVPCTVIAPSLIPSQSGDKVKTDDKDARKQARLLRAGELTVVRVPDETDEAIRDLCRARVDAHDDLRRARRLRIAEPPGPPGSGPAPESCPQEASLRRADFRPILANNPVDNFPRSPAQGRCRRLPLAAR